MNASQNYYALLGISSDASMSTIKLAFRRLAHRYHPDKSQAPDTAEKFAEISHAYTMLLQQKVSAGNSNPEKRASEEPIVVPTPPTTKKEKPYRLTVPLTVEQLYWGAELKLNPAAVCPGRYGKRNTQRLLKVTIPRGTRPGQTLRVRDRPAGREATEIQLKISLKRHERYDVVGDDLYVDMPLSAWEAQRGALVDVVTPGGRVEVYVPAGISSGQQVRVPNRGLSKSVSGSGDLLAVARVVSTQQRTRPLRKWPHLSHATASHWPSPAGSRTGENINIFA